MARRVLRVNQEEMPMHEAKEDAKESPFMLFLVVAAWFGSVSGNGIPGQRGEPGEGQES